MVRAPGHLPANITLELPTENVPDNTRLRE